MKQTAEDSDDDDSDDESVETQPPPAVVSVKKTDDTTVKSFTPTTMGSMVRQIAPEANVHVWTPNYIMFEYHNDEMKPVLVLLVRLSSGMRPECCDVQVSDDGEEIVVIEDWDHIMLDADAYYHKFPMHENQSDTEFNSRVNGLRNAIRPMKIAAGQNAVIGEFRVKTPFRVAPDDKKVTFTNLRSGCMVAHVDIGIKKKEVSNANGFLKLYDSDSEEDDIYTPVKLGKKRNANNDDGKLAHNRSNRKRKPNPKYTDSEEE